MQLTTRTSYFDFLKRLHQDHRGVSILEFAVGLPIFLTVGAYAAEMANLELAHLRTSQYALQIADNASRIGANSGLSNVPIREGDLNDVFEGLRLYSKNMNLTKYGRITVSSLENVSQTYDQNPVQRIHWQRCVGARSGPGYDSSYGIARTDAASDRTAATKGTDKPDGMGDPDSKVNAPPDTGVIFVEVNYDYQPLFGTMFMNLTKIHYTASFIIRDRRDFRQLYNPSPEQTSMTCDKWNA